MFKLSDMSPWPLCKINTLSISEAINKMINGHAGGLHERVDDNGPHEAEASSHHILANRLCLGTPQRNISWMLEFVHHWFVAHMIPHIATK